MVLLRAARRSTDCYIVMWGLTTIQTVTETQNAESMIRFKIFALTLSAVVLAACQTVDMDVPSDGAGFLVADDHPIQWQRTPESIVFRADVAGSNTLDPFLMQNEIPFCTIYGDNRIVWTNELGDFKTEVLWDIINDDAIRGFVAELVTTEAIYTYRNPPLDARDFNATLPPPIDLTQAARLLDLDDDRQNRGGEATQAVIPVDEPLPEPTDQPIGEPQPMVEEITLSVSSETVRVDGFSGWDADYFQRVVHKCRTISQTPVLYEPAAGWVTVRAVSYDSNVPIYLWNSASSGLNLNGLASSGEARWIEGNQVVRLWNALRNSSTNLMFLDGDGQYQVVLQVPGITRSSPPPPSA
jgi:hypothetical protein